jgi:membrane protein YdbS with pleckstrin-like domain
MLFEYKASNKRVKNYIISVVFNSLGFVAFEFFLPVFPGLSFLFLAAAVINLVLAGISFRKRQHIKFYENEIEVTTSSEDKKLSLLNLLYVQQFPSLKKTEHITHLVTDEEEYTFMENESEDYIAINEYLMQHAERSDMAKYSYKITQLRERIPSVIISFIFLIAYIYFFSPNGYNQSWFLWFFLSLQAISIIMFVGQWFYFKNKIKQAL